MIQFDILNDLSVQDIFRQTCCCCFKATHSLRDLLGRFQWKTLLLWIRGTAALRAAQLRLLSAGQLDEWKREWTHLSAALTCSLTAGGGGASDDPHPCLLQHSSNLLLVFTLPQDPQQLRTKQQHVQSGCVGVKVGLNPAEVARVTAESDRKPRAIHTEVRAPGGNQGRPRETMQRWTWNCSS